MTTAASLSSGGYSHGFGTTIADTTTASVTSGNKILGTVSWYGTGTLLGVTGGSLSWGIDVQIAGTTYHEAIIWADTPLGLPSGTVITATFSASVEDRFIRLAQVDGLIFGGADGAGSLPVVAPGAFSIPLSVGTTSDFVFAAGWIDNDFTGASWTGATELTADLSNAGGGGSGSYSWAYKTSVPSGSQPVAGTSPGNFTGVAAAYKIVTTLPKPIELEQGGHLLDESGVALLTES